jgi:hypothetical protein
MAQPARLSPISTELEKFHPAKKNSFAFEGRPLKWPAQLSG